MTALFHSIACTDTDCDPPRVVERPIIRSGGDVVRVELVELPGCPVAEEFDRDLALCGVADEICDHLETMLRQVLVDDRWIPAARNDAAVAIVRQLVASGRMPHPFEACQ